MLIQAEGWSLLNDLRIRPERPFLRRSIRFRAPASDELRHFRVTVWRPTVLMSLSHETTFALVLVRQLCASHD